MKHDIFLTYLYHNSSLSHVTKTIYMDWVTRCCIFHQKTHLLDLSPVQLDQYRLYLLKEKKYSLQSDQIVYNAFKHTYCILLPHIDPSAAISYIRHLHQIPRIPKYFPHHASSDEMTRFLNALPRTLVGHLIQEMYRTSQPFETIRGEWKCSKQYAQAVCAKTARMAQIPYRFGLTGVRASSLIHRLQQAVSGQEIVRIYRDSHLSTVQFTRYCKAAGISHALWPD